MSEKQNSLALLSVIEDHTKVVHVNVKTLKLGPFYGVFTLHGGQGSSGTGNGSGTRENK